MSSVVFMLKSDDPVLLDFYFNVVDRKWYQIRNRVRGVNDV